MLADDLFGAISLDGSAPRFQLVSSRSCPECDGVVADVLHHYAEALLARRTCSSASFSRLCPGRRDDPHRLPDSSRSREPDCAPCGRPRPGARCETGCRTQRRGAAPRSYPRRTLPVFRMDTCKSRRKRRIDRGGSRRSGELVRPPARVGPPRPIPAAEIGRAPAPLELNVARPQGLLLPPPLRDVVQHGRYGRVAVRIEHALRWSRSSVSLRSEEKAKTPRPGSGRRGRCPKNAFLACSLSSGCISRNASVPTAPCSLRQPAEAGFNVNPPPCGSSG